MYTRGKRTQQGKPDSVVGRGDQPEAGDSQIGRYGVAERPVVPEKPGNAGGGKGRQQIGCTLDHRATSLLYR